MVSLMVVFYMFVVLFAIIGAMRGWAQELLVSFSMILAFFLIIVIETVILKRFADGVIVDGSIQQFWLRIVIVIVLAFFGYQTPRITRFAAAVKKDRISDTLLGFFLGAINGYLVAGTLWFYMAQAGYPFKYFIDPNILSGIELNPPAQVAIEFVSKLPPAWLGTEPGIYIAVGLAFLFVLVVFI
jgi:uncharacterized membrane protein required for colicin V production